jgi:CDGSH-type Zn-finger protein
MAREVTHEARGPYIVTPEDIDAEKGDVAVCMCGLSDEYPFCDGSHRATADEDPETLYKYDDGTRRIVAAVEYADADDVSEE